MFNDSMRGLEGRVALKQLDEICDLSHELSSTVTEDADLPEWVQNHLAVIHDRLKSVHSYIIYEMRRSAPAMDPMGMIGQAPQQPPATMGAPMGQEEMSPEMMQQMMPKSAAYRAVMWDAFNDALQEKRAYGMNMAMPAPRMSAPRPMPGMQMAPPMPPMQPLPMMPPPAPTAAFQSSLPAAQPPQMPQQPSPMGSFRNALLGM